jgi:beta-lactamase regulating signal transducer with metallopeptidase domain
MASGLLLAFPLESVALRLALALGVALLLLRFVSGWDLRSPRARTVLAGSPFVVAAAVVVLSGRDLGLPSLLAPSAGGAGALALPVADRYLDFAPISPVIVGTWAMVSLMLIARRVWRAARFRRSVLAKARPAEPRVAAVVVRIARSLAVAPPRVLVTRGATGGAAVIGVRDPILLLDAEILHRLDAQELEGVLAHELAHVARRDNLVAWAVAVMRDIAFFVPGAGWAVRALHREREAAADQDAVAVTGRPAALASGLLNVVEVAAGSRVVPHGCAALVPSSTVVDRVQLLLSEGTVSPREHRIELALAAAVSLVAVAAALVIPGLLTGDQGQREALGVLVGAGPGGGPGPQDDATSSAGRVFTVYRQTGSDEAGSGRPVDPSVRGSDLFGAEDRPGVAISCVAGGPGCAAVGRIPGLALQPQPIVLLEDRMSKRWQATPMLDSAPGDRFAFYWLSRLVQTEQVAR